MVIYLTIHNKIQFTIQKIGNPIIHNWNLDLITMILRMTLGPCKYKNILHESPIPTPNMVSILSDIITKRPRKGESGR